MVDKDVSLGGAGDFDIKLAAGKASLTLNLVAPNAGLGLGASAVISLDAKALIDKVIAAIEAKSPAGVVLFEESVKAMIDAAVTSA